MENERGRPSYKRIFSAPMVQLDRIGSWGSPSFPTWGFWRHQRPGFTLRFREFVLVVGQNHRLGK